MDLVDAGFAGGGTMGEVIIAKDREITIGSAVTYVDVQLLAR